MERDDLEQWLKDRQKFREAAEAILDAEILWPASGRINLTMAEAFYKNYRTHSEAAFALVRQTMAVWEVDAGIDQHGYLPTEFEPSEEGFRKMHSVLEKNEVYMKLLRRATETVLEYVQEERKVLRDWYEENLLRKS